MGPDPNLNDVTSDAIECRLVELEAMAARIRAAQVQLLREFDVRQVPMADGSRDLAEWICARVDVNPENAAAMVRLVHTEVEEVEVAVSEGAVSFDRAVELARFEVDGRVEKASGYSIPRLRGLIAGKRRMTRSEERDRHAGRYLMLQPNLDQTSLRILGELEGIDAAAFEQTISDAADRFPALPSGRKEGRRARMADALVNIVVDSATSPVDGETAGGEPSTSSGPLVSILVDAVDATSTNGETGVRTLNGYRIGPDALEAILCDGVIEVNALTAEGKLLGVGDRSKTIPPRVRRFVFLRDQGMCTVDGCSSRYRLQPHHIRHRVEHHGDHDPANLTLLCWFHHHVVVHRRGHRIDPHSTPGRIRFLPPEPGKDPPI